MNKLSKDNGNTKRGQGVVYYGDMARLRLKDDKAQDAQTPDYASMVPEHERAVAVDRPVVTEITDRTPDYALMVPEDERAVTEKDELDIQLEKIGLDMLSPVMGMKGFQTDTGQKIYARIHANPKGERFIECVQQYSDGTFSSKMDIPQAELLIAAQFNFVSENIPETRLRNTVSKFMGKFLHDYMSQTPYPDEQMYFISVLNIILQNYRKLPFDSEIQLDNPVYLYKTVIRHIKNLGMELVDEHETYYTIFEDQMVCIAQKMGMQRLELLKKLKECNVLYLQGSSDGYQINVRFGGDNEFMQASHTERCYGIYKPEHLVKCINQSGQS